MKKHWTQFQYELKFALRSIRHHLLLALSAMSAVMISLMLISILLMVGIHINHFISNASDRMSIHVILEDGISQTKTQEVENELSALSNVEEVVFSDKDDELEIMISEKGEAYSMYRGENNPLSDAFFVYVKNNDDISSTSEQIEQISGVASVAYGGASTTSFISLLHTIRLITWGVVILLLLLSLYLIYNTIKSAIDTRKEEIQIMRQVGATDRFIQIPFEIEGILIGTAGALVPFVIALFGYPWLYQVLGGRILANVFSLLPPSEMLLILGLFLFAASILLGWLASYLAVKKYLEATR